MNKLERCPAGRYFDHTDHSPAGMGSKTFFYEDLKWLAEVGVTGGWADVDPPDGWPGDCGELGDDGSP